MRSWDLGLEFCILLRPCSFSIGTFLTLLFLITDMNDLKPLFPILNGPLYDGFTILYRLSNRGDPTRLL